MAERLFAVLKKEFTDWQFLQKGAFWTVYKAQYQSSVYALKKCQYETKKHRRRFHHEIFINNLLDHPNIVKMFGYFIDNYDAYMVFEYSDNGDIGKLSPTKQMVYQIVSSLSYCHSRGVVHRDVKPENILLFANDCYKLSDFGLARKVDPSKINTTLMKEKVGTVGLLAPELDFRIKYNYTVDIWSLGATVVYLWGHFTSNTICGRIARNHWPQKFLPPDMKDFITQCLKINPCDRMSLAMLMKHPFLQ